MTTAPDKRGERDASDRPSFLTFLDWLPWEKILIWSLFLLVVYALRDFFFLIFLTFILSYIMLGVVQRISRLLSPYKERIWLERILCVVCFALLLAGVYFAGNYLGPRLLRQGQQLGSRLQYVDPSTDFRSILAKAGGPLLFKREYGGPESPAYREAFEEFRAAGAPPVERYKRFGTLSTEMTKNFDILLDDEIKRLREELSESEVSSAFRKWFLKRRAPEIYTADPSFWEEQWEDWYSTTAMVLQRMPSLEEFRAEPDYETEKLKQIYAFIELEYPKRNPDRWQEDQQMFKSEFDRERVAVLKSSDYYKRRFRDYYEAQREERSSEALPEYDTYLRLVEAHAEGEAKFAEVAEELGWLKSETEEERLEQAHRDFVVAESDRLADEFFSQGYMERVINVGEEYVQAGLSKVPGLIQSWVSHFTGLVLALALAFLLSLFITFDAPRIRRGIKSLERSRVQGFYHEIAPGLRNFGRLIGRAFQAQGVIAIFNTLLTLAAIKLLKIENEIFLCVIVFVCSFIPILGVVLSSVPIAIMALVQQDGSIWLALQIVGAILVIHFIETSVLNPKILGDMLHLHPVLVLAVLAVGEHFFGIWGLLLAVPVTVYIIRCVILGDGIPGLIEPSSQREPFIGPPKSARRRLEPAPVVESGPPVGAAGAVEAGRGGARAEDTVESTTPSTSRAESRR